MKLTQEIKQRRPFPSVQEEAILALVRTADQFSAPLAEVLRGTGLSQSQYNILRILRGSAPDGLSCGDISERMVRRDPDLTRLLDKLEGRGLVTRTRSTADRRVVLASITDEGLALLVSLDEPVRASIKASLAHVPAARLRSLIEILEELRAAG